MICYFHNSLPAVECNVKGQEWKWRPIGALLHSLCGDVKLGRDKGIEGMSEESLFCILFVVGLTHPSCTDQAFT